MLINLHFVRQKYSFSERERERERERESDDNEGNQFFYNIHFKQK